MANHPPSLRRPDRHRRHQHPPTCLKKAIQMQRFDDRRILITGAGSGIGQATVARLLDEGGKVVAYDVSEDGLAATAAAADDAGTGKRLTTVVLDVSSEDEVATAVDAAAAELGG